MGYPDSWLNIILVFLWISLWMRWYLNWVDWIRQIAIPNVGMPNQLKGWMKQKMLWWKENLGLFHTVMLLVAIISNSFGLDEGIGEKGWHGFLFPNWYCLLLSRGSWMASILVGIQETIMANIIDTFKYIKNKWYG